MKHWVFDLDGTLVDSAKYYDKSITTIFAEQGIRATDEDRARAYRFFNPAEYFATCFNDAEKVATAVSRLMELNKIYASEIPAYAGVKELLIFLQSKNVKVSVWTGRELETAKKILASTGLEAYVGLCVGRTCVKNNKPYPDGLLKILTDSKSHGDDVLMIGDHEFDVQGARAAKVKVFSVCWGPSVSHGASAISDRHFERVEDLHSWAAATYDAKLDKKVTAT